MVAGLLPDRGRVRASCQRSTDAAKQWMDGMNAESNNGHCFGMATTAWQIFDRLFSARSLGGSTTHRVGFAPKSTSPIAQEFSTRKLIDIHLTCKHAMIDNLAGTVSYPSVRPMSSKCCVR